MTEKKIPISINLNENAKQAVVAIAAAVILVSLFKLIQNIGGTND